MEDGEYRAKELELDVKGNGEATTGLSARECRGQVCILEIQVFVSSYSS